MASRTRGGSPEHARARAVQTRETGKWSNALSTSGCTSWASTVVHLWVEMASPEARPAADRK
eukprot:8531536-Lingulodinium_polyedra.AAC.1